jgi:hypothetical protein
MVNKPLTKSKPHKSSNSLLDNLASVLERSTCIFVPRRGTEPRRYSGIVGLGPLKLGTGNYPRGTLLLSHWKHRVARPWCGNTMQLAVRTVSENCSVIPDGLAIPSEGRRSFRVHGRDVLVRRKTSAKRASNVVTSKPSPSTRAEAGRCPLNIEEVLHVQAYIGGESYLLASVPLISDPPCVSSYLHQVTRAGASAPAFFWPNQATTA